MTAQQPCRHPSDATQAGDCEYEITRWDGVPVARFGAPRSGTNCFGQFDTFSHSELDRLPVAHLHDGRYHVLPDATVEIVGVLANDVVHLQISGGAGTSAVQVLEGSYPAVFRLA
jgi:hypothetical protein